MTTEPVWINGEIVPMADARVGVEDRGFQFADGVYEVVRLYAGVPFTFRQHLDRIERSAAGIKLSLPMSRADLEDGLRKLIAKSGVLDGMIYLQATRGVAPRNHVFPATPTGTVVAYCRPLPPVPEPGTGEGVRLLPVPDERWKRCWIKAIALLPNVLAKNEAVAAGYDEAAFVDDGVVNECSASNLFAVVDGKLVTHPVGPKVLPGITRAVLLECAAEAGIEVEERGIGADEALGAQEMFITSTTREASWVTRWGEAPIGRGRCGAVTLRLHKLLQERVRAEVAGE